MKVLQVIDTLNVGGAERVCVDLSNLLIDDGVDVGLLLISDQGELVKKLNEKVNIFFLNRTSKFDLTVLSKLRNIIKKYDIIHVHMRFTFRYVKLFSLLFRINKPIVLHDHFGSIGFDKSIPFLMNSLLKPNYYIGVSEELTIWARKNLKLKKNNIYLLKNIVVKDSVRNEFYIDKSKDTIVLVANIKPVKNQFFAIQLIEHTKYNLDIYGNILDEDYYNFLVDYIKTKKLHNRVTFIHNEINIQSKLHQYLFGLHVAKSESGPLVLIEFLVQGLPFVTYNTGEVVNLIKNELPFIVNDFSFDSWLKKIEIVKKYDTKILEDVYLRFFNPQNYLKECTKIYQEIVTF